MKPTTKTEDIKAFYEKFNETKLEISEALNAISQKDSDDEDYLKSIATNLLTLEKSVQNAGNLLPGYDQRQYLLQLRELHDKLEKERQSRRKAVVGKFSFNRKSVKKDPSATVRKQAEAKSKDQFPEAQKMDVGRLNPLIDIFDVSETELFERDFRTLQSCYNDSDVCIERCSKAKIRVLGSVTALRIRNLSDCEVFVGPIAGSVFLEDCKNCKFQIACHQLRVHDVYDSLFYLHTTSKGIIEDSKGIKVSQYSFVYDGIEADWLKSALNRETNYWNEIQDFNWLSDTAASPNWSILDEDNKV